MFAELINHAKNVDDIMIYITAVSVIFLLGITIVMIYFVFKFNRKKNPKATDIHGNMILETIWILIPTLLALTMFYVGYQGFSDIHTIPDGAMKINVKAQMWKWTFVYDGGVESDTLYVPAGKPIALLLESSDVNHSLFIPAFREKQDAVYGKVNNLIIYPEEIGKYDIACAEYCGLNHSKMYTKLVVMKQDQFDEWYSTAMLNALMQ